MCHCRHICHDTNCSHGPSCDSCDHLHLHAHQHQHAPGLVAAA